MRQSKFRFFLIITGMLCAHPVLAAPGDLLNSYLGPHDAEAFGTSVIQAGNNILVGATITDVGGGQAAGAAYLIDPTTGAQVQSFLNPTPQSNDQFGSSLLAVGSDLYITAMWDNNSNGIKAGSTYLYGATGSQTLQAPSPNGFTFGSGLAVAGNHLVIGAEEGGNLGVGVTAFVYDLATGQLQRTIPSIGGRTNQTSSSAYLAAFGTNLLVGIPGDSAAGNYAGGVALIDPGTGNLLRTYHSPTNEDNAGFGFDVTTSGNKVIVSAPYSDINGHDSGAVYIIDGTTGNTLHTLLDPFPTDFGQFGRSIAVLGNEVLVGAPLDDMVPGLNSPEYPGAAYVFDVATGALLHTFTDPTNSFHDNFGSRVSTFNDSFLVSAPNRSSGTVYMFQGGFTAVPEPSTWTLAILAVALVSFGKKRMGIGQPAES